MAELEISFDDAACTCEHGHWAHDDGFGCTERDCPCIAGWVVTFGPAGER